MMAASGHEQVPHFSSPQEEALLNIIRSADCLHRAFQQRLKPFGLTATQYNALRILRGAHPDGLTCSAIGSMMITPEPDITRLLARLKAQRLVTQRRDQHDRRVVWTHLSAQGRELLADLDGVVDQAPRELLGALNCQEVGELTRLLEKAHCCGGRENAGQNVSQDHVSQDRAPLTGKPLSPHSRPSTGLRPRPE
jgi:DNA-binding MarR family transcriptional regulator